MTKLLIDAHTLQQMMKAHPEVEVELVKNASAQIAEILKRKIADPNGLADSLSAKVNDILSRKYSMPDPVKKLIVDVVMKTVVRFNQSEAEKLARAAITKYVDGYGKDIERRLDGMITTAVEKKVAAVFATAARLGK